MLKLIFSLTTLWWMILLLYIPACFGLIIIVLLQKGKGQGLAGAFGMGGVDAIFGPRSSKSLPQKVTYASAAIFMSLALIMSILSGKVGRSAAPELIEEKPAATMEALFDENAAPSEDASVSVTTEGETASAPAAAAPSLEGLTIEQPVVEVSVDEPTAETVVETPVAIPAETPEAAPADSSVVEVPAETTVEQVPAETPAREAVVEETPAETSAETTANQ